MPQIKFTCSGHSAVFGAFSAGDLLRCDDQAAKHFVDDARCAVYTDAAPQSPDALQTPAAAAPTPPAPPARKRAQKP